VHDKPKANKAKAHPTGTGAEAHPPDEDDAGTIEDSEQAAQIRPSRKRDHGDGLIRFTP